MQAVYAYSYKLNYNNHNKKKEYMVYQIPLYSLVVLYNHLDRLCKHWTTWADCLTRMEAMTMICTLFDDIGVQPFWTTMHVTDLPQTLERPKHLTTVMFRGKSSREIRTMVAEHLLVMSKYVAFRTLVPAPDTPEPEEEPDSIQQYYREWYNAIIENRPPTNIDNSYDLQRFNGFKQVYDNLPSDHRSFEAVMSVL
jgi:hypothetical protein